MMFKPSDLPTLLSAMAITMVVVCYVRLAKDRDETAVSIIECMADFHDSNPDTFYTDREVYDFCLEATR